MKRLINFFFFLFFTLFSFNTILADNFQFLYEDKYGEVVYVSYSQINIYYDYELIFQEETNRFGKIRIDLKPGTYTLEVYFNKQRIEKKIRITGKNSGFKRIYL